MLKIYRIVTVSLLVGWMVMVYSLSAQTATESSATSGSIIEFIAKVFYPHFNMLDEIGQKEIIEQFQFVARKGAHFTIYAIMGVLSFLSVITYKQFSLFLRALVSVGICLIYSISDEFHQLSVVGRSGEIRDVLIDLCGCMLVVCVMTLIFKKSKFKICRTFL